jgi:hypothetical protein
LHLDRPDEASMLLQQATAFRQPGDREITLNIEVINALRRALNEHRQD